jgi:NAD(P)-dependent dehydrogenase (short-subunit alcohol dehydrogenase family)
MQMRLAGKTAVITGAASGIGRATAIRFAAEGAKLIVGDRHEERLKEVVATIRSAGGAVISAVGDIAQRQTAESLVDLAVESHGRIDVLVNNAGTMDHFQGVGELSDEMWRRVFAINVDGPMFTSRRAVPHMVKQGGGSIVNMGSMSGYSGASAGVAYTASKHAVLGLTRATAWRYAKEGIRCNAICPGAVRTNIEETMPRDQIDPAGFERSAAFFMLTAAILEPTDIAALALYLASDEARFVNGAAIGADSGMSAA